MARVSVSLFYENRSHSILRNSIISAIVFIFWAICDFSSSSNQFNRYRCFFSLRSSSSILSNMPRSWFWLGGDTLTSSDGSLDTSSNEQEFHQLLFWVGLAVNEYIDFVVSYSVWLKSLDSLMMLIARSRLCYKFLLDSLCLRISVLLALFIAHSVPYPFSYTLVIYQVFLWDSVIRISGLFRSSEHLDDCLERYFSLSAVANGLHLIFHRLWAVAVFFSFLTDLRFIT